LERIHVLLSLVSRGSCDAKQARESISLRATAAGWGKYLDRADFVIIGNGIAGLTAAVEARRLAPQKRIVMITDQLYPTINTPALKQFAIGNWIAEQTSSLSLWNRAA